MFGWLGSFAFVFISISTSVFFLSFFLSLVLGVQFVFCLFSALRTYDDEVDIFSLFFFLPFLPLFSYISFVVW